MTIDEDDVDTHRFRELFDAHYSSVWSYCRRRLRAADVDDTVAEVFTVAWRRIREIPDEPMTRAWLLRTAFNTSGHSIRSNGRWLGLHRRAAVHRDAVAQPDEQALLSAEADQVLRALAMLAPADQELLRLVAWEQLSREEIAAVLGCSPNAITIRLHRARRRMTRLLAAENGEVSSQRPRIPLVQSLPPLRGGSHDR